MNEMELFKMGAGRGREGRLLIFSRQGGGGQISARVLKSSHLSVIVIQK